MDLQRDKDNPNDLLIANGDLYINNNSIIQHYYDILIAVKGVFLRNTSLGMDIKINYVDNENIDMTFDFVVQLKSDNLQFRQEYYKIINNIING